MGERAAYTGAGVALVAWWLIPTSALAPGPLAQDFSVFIVGGLMVVVGATWTLMYNADVLLGVAARPLARLRGLAPVVKMAMAYRCAAASAPASPSPCSRSSCSPS